MVPGAARATMVDFVAMGSGTSHPELHRTPGTWMNAVGLAWSPRPRNSRNGRNQRNDPLRDLAHS
jgi:hypothetical protein